MPDRPRPSLLHLAIGSFAPDSWLTWLNRYRPEETPHPEAWRAADLLAEAEAAGKELTAGQARKIKRVLEPFVQAAMRDVPELVVLPDDGFSRLVKKGRIVSPKPSGRMLTARIRSTLDPEHPLGPTCYILVGLFRFLQERDHSKMGSRLRRCTVCNDLFIDRSKGHHGRFCSARCRTRNARST